MNQAWKLSSGAVEGEAGAGREEQKRPEGPARLRLPERAQHVFEDSCLEYQLPPEHRARLVWTFVERSDTAALEARVRARGDRPGAPAIDPRLLLALWLYATLEGVGSARELERLCEEHTAYRWLCGRVGVNHHTLADFRADLGEFLDDLLTRMIAALVHAGVVDASVICQDGTKVRAAAGAGSFRRAETLARLEQEARAHLARVRTQADDPSVPARVCAARERAARERLERVEAALKVLPELEKKREARGRQDRTAPLRASTTDAGARRMKTGDGGTRPAYNVQLGTDAASRAIVGVQVVAAGNDLEQLAPMRRDVERRTGVRVGTHIADGGYRSKEQIEEAESAGVACVIPLPKKKDGTLCTMQPDDGPGVKLWRARMQTPAAIQQLKARSGIAETPNAELKTYRSMDRMPVRGLAKVTAVVLLSAVVYNLLHFATVLTT